MSVWYCNLHLHFLQQQQHNNYLRQNKIIGLYNLQNTQISYTSWYCRLSHFSFKIQWCQNIYQIDKENEWDHSTSTTVKEGPADCIRIDEVAAALKKMKKHKAPGLSGLVAEMIQTTGNTGTQWNCEKRLHPRGWKSSVVLPIYKGKGDPMEYGSYRGIKLLEHATKVVERIFKDIIRQQIDIDDM